jgi:hypothetical protein
MRDQIIKLSLIEDIFLFVNLFDVRGGFSHRAAPEMEIDVNVALRTLNQMRSVAIVFHVPTRDRCRSLGVWICICAVAEEETSPDRCACQT